MGAASGGQEESLTKELFRPFAFGLHAIGRCCIRVYGGVVRFERCVEAIKGSPSMGSLIIFLGGDEALGVSSPHKFDGLQEVAQDLSEAFKVVFGWFPGDGRQFNPPILEEGDDLLDCGNLVLNHIGKLIAYDEERHGTL